MIVGLFCSLSEKHFESKLKESSKLLMKTGTSAWKQMFNDKNFPITQNIHLLEKKVEFIL